MLIKHSITGLSKVRWVTCLRIYLFIHTLGTHFHSNTQTTTPVARLMTRCTQAGLLTPSALYFSTTKKQYNFPCTQLKGQGHCY